MKKYLHPSFAKATVVTTTTVIGTKNEDGTANFTTVAWTAPCNPAPLRFCVALNRAHLVTENILRETTFTIKVWAPSPP